MDSQSQEVEIRKKEITSSQPGQSEEVPGQVKTVKKNKIEVPEISHNKQNTK